MTPWDFIGILVTIALMPALFLLAIAVIVFVILFMLDWWVMG